VINSDFEALEREHSGMLHKFAKYNIGMEYEDLLQELRITMWNASRKYNPDLNTKFSTYLFSALRRRVQKLNTRINNVQSRIPPAFISHINEGVNEGDIDTYMGAPQFNDDVSTIDLLSNASKPARTMAGLILSKVDKKDWENYLPKNKIKSGLDEIREIIKKERDV
jgi:RNA polymerase sigma factor (sigma-70 family)